MNSRYPITFLFAAIIIISSCKRPDEFPNEPLITFKSLSVLKNAAGYDMRVDVLVDFTDGDGDLGYKQLGSNDPVFDDPTSQYYNNYKVNVFHFKNNVWNLDTVKLDGRMPYLTPEGNNKALKGQIKYELVVAPNLVNDTTRYEIFIYDRAFHQSNTVTTASVVLNTQ